MKQEPGKKAVAGAEARFRSYHGWPGILVKIAFITLPCMSIAWVFNATLYLRLTVYPVQYLGIFLGLVLCLIFLVVPPIKGFGLNKLPLYDAILALAGAASGGYLAIFYTDLMFSPFRATVADLIFGVMTVMLILEASRRLMGWTLTSIGIIFILYGLYNNLLPGFLHGPGYSWKRLITYLYFQESGIPGTVLNIAATIVLAYLLFGQTLLHSGGGQLITNFCLSLVGRYRGGPAKVAVVASSLFGTVSGSAVSNVLTTGTFTIPMMKSTGYRPHFAGAVEAVSSTGGILMPPVMGAAAFLLAEFLQLGYAQVAIAAALPAILYYLGIFIQVDLEAAKMGLRGIPRNQIPPLKSTIYPLWQFVLPVAVLIFLLVALRFNATTAGLYAAALVIVVSFFKKETRLGASKIIRVLESTGQNVLDVGLVCAFAGIIIGVVNLTGLGITLSRFLLGFAGSNILPVLLIAAIASIILGMGVPMTACYVLLAILIAPVIVALGIMPLAAHMFIFYFGAMSFITPPVAPAAYAAASLANSDFWRTGWQAMRLAIIAYIVPFIFVFDPVLLMRGSVLKIIIHFSLAVIGVIFLGVGLEGYLNRRITWLERLLFVVGGIGLLAPPWQAKLLVLAPILWEWELVLTVFRNLLGRVACTR